MVGDMTDMSMAHSNKDLVVSGMAEFATGNIDVLRTLLREGACSVVCVRPDPDIDQIAYGGMRLG